MQIRKNLKKFLYDQEYFIDIFQNCLHVYYYEELLSLSNSKIELKLKDFVLKIIGKNLIVSSMDKQEILIKGLIEELGFVR